VYSCVLCIIQHWMIPTILTVFAMPLCLWFNVASYCVCCRVNIKVLIWWIKICIIVFADGRRFERVVINLRRWHLSLWPPCAMIYWPLFMLLRTVYWQGWGKAWQRDSEMWPEAWTGRSRRCCNWLNPLDSKSNYTATSNNTKLLHWPLTGGLLHLVQRGLGGAAACPGPSSLYQM